MDGVNNDRLENGVEIPKYTYSKSECVTPNDHINQWTGLEMDTYRIVGIKTPFSEHSLDILPCHCFSFSL